MTGSLSKSYTCIFYKASSWICRCCMGELYSARDKRLRKKSKWSCPHSYGSNQTCINSISFVWHMVGKSHIEKRKSTNSSSFIRWLILWHLNTSPHFDCISGYNLRNETNLQTVPARSQQCYNSFLPSTTRIWITHPDDTKNSPSWLGQIYHVRIRLNCSSLRYHLFQKKYHWQSCVWMRWDWNSYTAISTDN